MSARLFAAAGGRVVLAARGAEPLRALATELGDRAIAAVPTDVADPAACAALIDAALDATGRIDVLVNNAGCNHRGAVADLDIDRIEQILDVNLKAPLRLSRLALPHLMRQGGAIVNVASLAGRVPVDHEATYSASKFGLRAFSRALGEELAGSGVTVSAVSPGPIDTGFIMEHLDQVPDLVFSQPMSTAETVARQVLACAADGRRERAMPASSGVLTHLVYLFPALGRLTRPLLEAKGRRVKARYRQRS